ncbi:hypothetical protein Val02_12060 [Virgisporangium aliadipatigenens]|uniref:Exonuclease domain-containing protein n=1 Tax=Virgisporangium aliadipatigenens TaxID=741659 RepID=A0A8J4DMZ7_9ACTN|nr:exonuclease domain-containing protein [Virgisporangium aliadipatigenens]GIJ44320.1 hypothetical protein Val02_12060 [Virgisporangium aliadipatigenens]
MGARRRYAVVDVETTGLRPSADRVLQIAVIQLEADGSPGRSWSTLLDPGIDPGPVHIHGLSRERLAGAPLFPSVVHHLAELLEGRVLVAHNARFDWRFLAAEARRALHPLPVTERLCTLALTRRLDLPVPSLSLASLAAHWGVAQSRPHDAEDDTRVLAEILVHSLAAARRLAVRLPLTPCDPHDEPVVYPARAPRPLCPWAYPGRWSAGQPLVQGMKVAFTGPGAEPRELLMARAARAGLDVMNAVSGRTSLLVTDLPAPTATGAAPDDGGEATVKRRAAARFGTAVVSEAEFAALLGDVAAGVPRQAPPVEPPRVAPPGPLAGRCYLVVGGSAAEAAEVRARIGTLGGIAAVDVTARVTHLVALPGAEDDARWPRLQALGLHGCDPLTLAPRHRDPARTGPTQPPHAPATPAPVADDATAPWAGDDAARPGGEAVVLTRGAEADLTPECPQWTVSVRGPDGSTVDVLAFLADTEDQVRADADFVHRHAPAAADGAVELTRDTPHEVLVELRPGRMPPDVSRVAIAAVRPEGESGPIEVVVRDDAGAVRARATLDAVPPGRGVLLAHVDRRGALWRFRAVGRGFVDGAEGLMAFHGISW